MGTIEDFYAERLARDLIDACFGGYPQKQRPTAIRARKHGYGFEVVELDDAGKVIEPEPPCLRCGPVLACAKHICVT